MSSVFITNVDDYLAPSQACVNPIFADGVKETKKDESVIVPRKRTVRRKRPTVSASIPAAPSEPAKVSMADCLACSGCVTTAETVLVEQHSLSTLKEKIATSTVAKIVFTISPASWADLLRHLQVKPDDISITRQRLATMLHQTCRASVVLDGRIPLSWSLQQAADEFCQAHANKSQQGTDTPRPSVAVSSTDINVMNDDGKWETRNLVGTAVLPARLSIYSSSCPALVCLVEKSHAPVVPHLSTVKSPMALAGTWWKSQYNKQVLHISIMPCHDKKLEASRKDLTGSDEGPLADLVITTQEWLELFSEACGGSQDVHNMRIYLENLEPAAVVHQLDQATDQSIVLVEPTTPDDSEMTDSNGSRHHFVHGSGGYADYIFRHAAKTLYGYEIQEALPWKPVEISRKTISARVASRPKNQFSASLYQLTDGTCSLEAPSDASAKPLLSFCLAHGQQTLQRVLADTTTYDYVEAMACPSGGCTNGGGQVRLAARERPTETRERVTAAQAYFVVSAEDDCMPLSANQTKTRFHVVPPLQHSLGAATGVAVQDMQW